MVQPVEFSADDSRGSRDDDGSDRDRRDRP